MNAAACSRARGRSPRRPASASAFAVTVEKELRRLRPRQGLDVQTGSHRRPVRVSRRDEGVAVCCLGKASLHRLCALGVVEDEQPPIPLSESVHGSAHHLLQVLRRRDAELGCERSVVRVQGRGRLGPHPPHDVVGELEPVRVLERDLCLSDPSEARHCNQRRARSGLQARSDPIEQVIASYEVPIPQMRDVPDFGSKSRDPRPRTPRRRN